MKYTEILLMFAVLIFVLATYDNIKKNNLERELISLKIENEKLRKKQIVMGITPKD